MYLLCRGKTTYNWKQAKLQVTFVTSNENDNNHGLRPSAAGGKPAENGLKVSKEVLAKFKVLEGCQLGVLQQESLR
jgi:hypothetical protein